MATKREPMDPELRERVLVRDDYACRKCGLRKYPEAHHIIPIPEGQIDTEENLVTLCKYCHREWEQMVYRYARDVSFLKWVELPPAFILIKIFTDESCWPTDMSAKEAREMMLRSCHMLRDFGPSEKSEVLIKDRQSARYGQTGILIDKSQDRPGIYVLFSDGKREHIHGCYQVVKENEMVWSNSHQEKFGWWDEYRNDQKKGA